MSISWIRCLPKKSKANLDLLSIQSEDIKRFINEKLDMQSSKRLVETTPCLNACFDELTSYGIKNYGSSNANTISDMNISNVFEHNPEMVRASSFIWPEVDMDHRACTGHECLLRTDSVNKIILYQRRIDKDKREFTPPLFPETGIDICHKRPPKVSYESDRPLKSHVSVLEDHVNYKTPGNMEFIDYTYPSIGHKWRYTTYAVPLNRSDWEWIYNFIRNIKNSFRRKYLCEVLLSSEPGKYKGHVAYLVRLESATQGHILQCRGGLPKCLKDILVVPDNAHLDIECFVSEYLIKRKYIFRTIRNMNGPETAKSQVKEMHNLKIISQSSEESRPKDLFKPKLEVKNEYLLKSTNKLTQNSKKNRMISTFNKKSSSKG